MPKRRAKREKVTLFGAAKKGKSALWNPKNPKRALLASEGDLLKPFWAPQVRKAEGRRAESDPRGAQSDPLGAPGVHKVTFQGSPGLQNVPLLVKIQR